MNSQQQDLRITLEAVQQENKTIKLEKIVYEKEITYLKQQNQQLMKEKIKFFETMQIEQTKLSHSKSLSDELEFIHFQNDDLLKQIAQYQSLTNRLNNKNKACQTEISKYQTCVEQLSEQSQKKHKIHSNERLKLQNKIGELQNECDTLREAIDIKNNALPFCLLSPNTKCPSIDSQKSYEPRSEQRTNDFIFRLNSMVSTSVNYSSPKALYHQLHFKSPRVQNQSNNNCSINYDDIVSQLVQFGYNKNEIMAAMNVTDIMDINQILEVLQNMKLQKDDSETKEIAQLKRMNNVYARKIKRLQQRIRCLQLLEGTSAANDGCFLSRLFSFV